MKGIKGANHKFNLEGAGRIPDTIHIEENLMKLVEEQRHLEIAINTNEIINKTIEMDNKLSDKSYYALHCWCYRFLARYSYSIRKPTHVGQKLKDNAGTEYRNFYNIL